MSDILRPCLGDTPLTFILLECYNISGIAFICIETSDRMTKQVLSQLTYFVMILICDRIYANIPYTFACQGFFACKTHCSTFLM